MKQSWYESDRGVVKALAIYCAIVWPLIALIWSWLGATVVVVPLGFAALALIAIGGWMHRF